MLQAWESLQAVSAAGVVTAQAAAVVTASAAAGAWSQHKQQQQLRHEVYCSSSSGEILVVDVEHTEAATEEVICRVCLNTAGGGSDLVPESGDVSTSRAG